MTVTAWVRSNKLSTQRVGRRLAFEPGVVASLKALKEAAKEGGGKAAKPRRAIELIREQNLLTTNEVALQLRISRTTVTAWVRLGLLPAQRIGRQWAFQPRDIEASRETVQANSKERKRALSQQAMDDIRMQGLLTVEDVASQCAVTSSSVTLWARLNKLPSQRIGRRLAFRTEDVFAFRPAI